jgi:hypothetical protein
MDNSPALGVLFRPCGPKAYSALLRRTQSTVPLSRPRVMDAVMMDFRSLPSLLLCAIALTACGGGSGGSADGGGGTAPVVTFDASPTTLSPGKSSTLSWNATNATTCTASGAWSGAKATSGSESTGPLQSSKSYTITCGGSGGTMSQTVGVTVTTPAPTLTLGANPASVASGGSSTLAWTTTDTTSCAASGGWAGSQSTSGTISTGALSATTMFTLTCSGPGGSVTQSTTVTVTVAPPPPAVTLTANPSSVIVGNTTQLTWSSSNATICAASGGWTGSRQLSGTETSSALNATTNFTLSCTGNGGTTTRTITVTASAAPAPTVSLSANPLVIASGATSTLTWSSTNAAGCNATIGWLGPKGASGTETTSPLSATTTFTLTCTGTGGSANASVTVTVGVATGVAFPLHTEAGKRYLVDANGNPFFIHGDTPWDLAAQLTREDVDVYLENRHLKGDNAILIEMMEHRFSSNPPYNVYGEPPFTTAGDFSTPNEAYFAHVEYIVAKAESKGMLVMITPAYLGYGGGTDGWYQEMVANGEAKLRTYGQYVANRFKAYDNILWVQGGDYNPPEKALVRAIANGIRDITPSALQTFHGDRGFSALAFYGTSEPWLTVNDIFTDQSTVVSKAFTEYGRSSMPFFLIEAVYEGDTGGTETVARAQAYQAVLSGASGHLYGNDPVWYFGTGWQPALDTPGAVTLKHLKALFDSFAWWTLVPDSGNTFLTAGVSSGSSRAVAARAGTGAFAVIYMPSSRTITVTMSQLSGPNVQARWYDPTDGSYTTLIGSPFVASGLRSFTPTGTNSRGLGDWTLTLESVP